MNFSHAYSSALDIELGTSDSTQLFTTARRKNAINEAQLQWCDQTACVSRGVNITCSNGVSEYTVTSTSTLPDQDFLRLADLQPYFSLQSSISTVAPVVVAGEDLPRRGWDWLDQNEPGWRTSTGGTPHAWTQRSGAGGVFVGLVPPPLIGSSQTGTFTVFYVPRADALVSDTATPLSFVTAPHPEFEPYHQGLVHYAAYLLEKLRVNLEGANLQLQLFQTYVARYLRMSEPTGPRQVRTQRNYWNEVRGRRGSRDDSTPYPWRT